MLWRVINVEVPANLKHAVPVLMCGTILTNDIGKCYPREIALAIQQLICCEMRKAANKVEILVCGILPRGSYFNEVKIINNMLMNWCNRKKKCNFLSPIEFTNEYGNLQISCYHKDLLHF